MLSGFSQKRSLIGERAVVIGAGVSGLALLSESHLACHTYPEFRAATFNLYCCRERTTWPWELILKEMLGASDVNIRTFERIALQAEGAAR